MSDENLPTVIEPSKAPSDKLMEYRGIELQARNFYNSRYRGDCTSVQDAVVKILYGRELGIPPMEAMRNVHNIQNKPTPDYKLVIALILRHFPGTIFEWLTPLEERRKKCHLRVDSPQRGIHESEVELKDFQHKLNSDTWKKFPKRMLMSKATHEVGIMGFSDIITGCHGRSPKLISDTRKTVDEEENDKHRQKPVYRTDTLTEEHRASKEKQLDKLKEIDESEKDAQAMEAQWEKESQPNTLQ